METSAQDTLVVPGWKKLEDRLRRTRQYLTDMDEDGCMEGLFGLDMFRFAINPDMSRRDRTSRIMYAMGWMSFYIANRSADEVPDHMRKRAIKVNQAIGDLIEPLVRLPADEDESDITDLDFDLDDEE